MTNKSTNNAEVVKFEVVAMNGKQKELTFYNADLIEHTQKIQSYRDAGNLAILAIAHEFDKMDTDESYKTGGFKTVADYGRVVFDYKPATVSLYLRSARAFLTEDENGMIKYRDGLPKFTVGQMIELLPLVKDMTDISEVITALTESKINDRMSTKAMRDAVNEIRAIEGHATTKKAKDETSEIAKAEKLGEYVKDKLPKGMTSKDYAKTSVQAALEAMANAYHALQDCEINETMVSKVENVSKELTEIIAELGA